MEQLGRLGIKVWSLLALLLLLISDLTKPPVQAESARRGGTSWDNDCLTVSYGMMIPHPPFLGWRIDQRMTNCSKPRSSPTKLIHVGSNTCGSGHGVRSISNHFEHFRTW